MSLDIPCYENRKGVTKNNLLAIARIIDLKVPRSITKAKLCKLLNDVSDRDKVSKMRNKLSNLGFDLTAIKQETGGASTIDNVDVSTSLKMVASHDDEKSKILSKSNKMQQTTKTPQPVTSKDERAEDAQKPAEKETDMRPMLSDAQMRKREKMHGKILNAAGLFGGMQKLGAAALGAVSVQERNSDTVDVDKHYKMIKVAGEGAFGQVKIMMSKKDRKKYAIKFLNNYDDMAEQEVLALSKFTNSGPNNRCHPNIVCYYGSFFTKPTADAPQKQFAIVMENIEGDDLRQIVFHPSNKDATHISVENACRLTGGLLSALSVVHAQGLAHNDIKPANVMYREQKRRGRGLLSRKIAYVEPVLVDFGLACKFKTVRDATGGQLKSCKKSPRSGSVPFMSIDRLTKCGRKATCSSSVLQRNDLFALGLTLWSSFSRQNYAQFLGWQLNKMENLATYHETIREYFGKNLNDWSRIYPQNETISSIVQSLILCGYPDLQPKCPTAASLLHTLQNDSVCAPHLN